MQRTRQGNARTIDVVGCDADTPPHSLGATGVGIRFAVGFSLAIGLALVISLVALDRFGVAERTAPTPTPPPFVVQDSRELLDAWNTAGLHGVHLIDVTRDLGYAYPPGAIPQSTGWPVPHKDLQDVFRTSVEHRSIIWVAAKTGVARSVTYVVMPTDLSDKVSVGREKGFPGIAPDGSSITANDDGYVRLIGDRFPAAPTGPVALNIDASYFVSGTPEGLIELLDASPLTYSFVTLNRSTDATDVPEAARARLDRAAELLRQRVPK